jgi:AhpD family alkylhydroperoxidase
MMKLQDRFTANAHWLLRIGVVSVFLYHGILKFSNLEGAYLTLSQIFDKSSLTAVERQVAILAISRYNECDYCMAAHSVIAAMQKVPPDVIQAVRDDQPIADAKLEALRVFASAMVDKRGWLAEDEVAAFLEAGYSKAQVLEIVLAASLKTVSNYANHLAETPLDDAFASRAWEPVQSPAA